MEFFPFNPIAFYLFSFPIRWYGLAYVISFVMGEWYCLRLTRFFEAIKPHHIEGFVVWAIVGILLGGRLGHGIIYDPSLFLHNPLKLLHVWEGGMSFHGGLVGAALACWVYCRRHSLHVGHFSDLMVCAIPLGLFWGRLGNFINQELCGRPTTCSWGLVFPLVDGLNRHPSQLYQALGEGVILGGLLRYSLTLPGVSSKPGVLTGLFLIGYGLIRFFIEFLREPEFYWGLLTIGQWLTLPLMGGGMALVGYTLRKKKVKNI